MILLRRLVGRRLAGDRAKLFFDVSEVGAGFYAKLLHTFCFCAASDLVEQYDRVGNINVH